MAWIVAEQAIFKLYLHENAEQVIGWEMDQNQPVYCNAPCMYPNLYLGLQASSGRVSRSGAQMLHIVFVKWFCG